MKLMITIDTEADNQWARNETIELNNIDYIPRFQEMCAQYGFKPTYLITYAMARSERFLEVVGPYQAEQKAEIGAHLHPWTTPPFIPLTENDMFHHPFPHEYPEETLRQKLIVLTETIERNFGQRPVTFRAGRYGFDEKVATCLADLGYIADCSVTPLVSWRKTLGSPRGSGGPDFSGAPQQAYFVKLAEEINAEHAQLLEVPISIFFVKWPGLNRVIPLLKKAFNDPQNVIMRILYKLGHKPVWFRPHPERRTQDLFQVYQVARSLGCEYVEMMFHSSELMPGGSKNTPDQAAIERLYTLFHALFQRLSGEQIESVSLREYATERIRKEPGGDDHV